MSGFEFNKKKRGGSAKLDAQTEGISWNNNFKVAQTG
jgi:hypothetical protein